MNLIAEGTDISELEKQEPRFAEGEKGELRFYIEKSLTKEQLNQLEQDILAQGVYLTEPIKQDARIIFINFEKRIAPLIIIGGAIIAAIGGAAFLGWQLSKAPLGIPWWLWVVGGGALLYLLFRTKPAKRVAGTVIKAGKVYVTRKALKNDS